MKIGGKDTSTIYLQFDIIVFIKNVLKNSIKHENKIVMTFQFFFVGGKNQK